MSQTHIHSAHKMCLLSDRGTSRAHFRDGLYRAIFILVCGDCFCAVAVGVWACLLADLSVVSFNYSRVSSIILVTLLYFAGFSWVFFFVLPQQIFRLHRVFCLWFVFFHYLSFGSWFCSLASRFFVLLCPFLIHVLFLFSCFFDVFIFFSAYFPILRPGNLVYENFISFSASLVR